MKEMKEDFIVMILFGLLCVRWVEKGEEDRPAKIRTLYLRCCTATIEWKEASRC